MRKKIVALFITIMTGSILTACASTVHESEPSEADNETGAVVSAERPTAASDEVSEEQSAAQQTDAEISYDLSAVPYQGEAFTKSVFSAGGEELYICGIKSDGTYFLGCMEEEEDSFREFEVSMDEGMRAFNMAVDAQGNCHILWMSVGQVTLNGQVLDSISYEKSFITVVDPDGETEQKINVTDVFGSRYTRPYCLAVDEEGNYYLENGSTLVEILANGTLGNVVSCDGEIEGVGIGKSGTVYCVYYTEDGETTLAKLEDGSIVSCGVTLPDTDALYSGVYPGADAELLLFSKSGGIYAYDGNALEERVSSTKMPVEGQDIAGHGVMSDGRICILEEKNGEQTFYYIPTAKEQ